MKKFLLLFVLIALAAVLFGCTQNFPSVDMGKLSTPPAASIGSASAPIVVVEYSDYQCPLCRKWFLDSKKQLFDEYVCTGKVRFEFKDFPLTNNHPLASMYASALRCAGEQIKYWEMHDKVYSGQDKLAGGSITIVTDVTAGDVASWAEEIGLNKSAFNECLVSGKFDSEISANESEGVSIGIDGTPSFVIAKATSSTGELIAGAQPYSVFKAKIEEMLK